MATVGVLEIQMAADLARLSKDMSSARRTVSNTVSNINKVLGAIGVGLSLNFFKNLATETTRLNQRYQELGISLSVVGRNVGIQRQELDKTATSLQRLGISMIESRQTVLKLASANIELSKAEQLADLARNAAIVGQINTSEALGRIVHGIRSAELEVLKTIGITVSFEQSYKDLAAQLGVTTKELTQSQKQHARLNVVLAEAPALAGLYTAAMGNAGKQFRSTDRLVENLKVRIGGLFDLTARAAISAYTDLLKDMDGTIDDVTESGEFQRWGDDVARTLAFMADAVTSVKASFNILGLSIGATIAQMQALATLDIDSFNSIQQSLDEDIQSEIESMSRARDAIEEQIIQRDLLTDAVTGVSNSIQKKEKTDQQEIVTTGKQVDQAQKFIDSLKKQAEEAGKTAEQIQRMEAAQLGVLAAAEPYLRIIEDQRIAEEDLRISRERQADDLRRIEQITDSVKTKQEVYNETVKELDDLLTKGLGLETYNRALQEAQEELHGITDVTKTTTDQVSQMWVQAGRRIQDSIADAIFNIKDGFGSLVSSVGTALGRIASQLVALKISDAVGLSAAFGLPSTASASGGGVSVGITDILSTASSLKTLSSFGANTSLFNTLSAGANAVGFTGAGGVPALSAFSNVGGAGTAFIGGQGTALGGVGLSGAGTSAASLTGLVSTVAPVLAGASLGVFGGSLIAGNKELAGLNGLASSGIGAGGGAVAGAAVAGPIGAAIGAIIGGVLGGTINKLFGRADPKFSREELVGTITAEGFSGALNSSFKEKGGTFRSSRFSNFIADTDTGELLNNFGRLNESGNFPGGLAELVGPRASERALLVGDFLDEAFTSVADTLKSTGEVLGISTEGLKDFSFELDIISDKAKTLSEEQIAEVISDVSNEMVESFIPNIQELARNNESAVETLSRLSIEFTTLQRALLVAGDSADTARTKLQGLDFEQRTDLVDEIGGIQAFNAELSSFVDNVLNDSQKIDLAEQQILSLLEQFDVGFIPTTEQLFEAFKSGNPEFVKAAFAVDELVVQLENLKESSEQAANKERALAKERNAFTAARRESQAGGLAPTIATTIGSKIFTEAEIRAQQQSALDSALQSAKSAVEEQLSRLTESMRTARSMVQDQLSAVTESIRFFDRFKEDSLEVANKSFFAAKEQLDASIALAKAGATVQEIDTPELANAISTLKRDRSDFFATRKEFEKDKAETAQKLAELSSIGKDASTQQIDLLTEQLEVMQATFDVETRSLNGLLEFINFQGNVENPAESVTRLSDDALSKFASDSIKSLNLNERIQRNTSFNGSVQFPFPAGTNESADNADRARVQTLSTFQSNAKSGGDVSSDILTELRNLKKEISGNKEATDQLYKLMNNVTRGGRAMQTQAAS